MHSEKQHDEGITEIVHEERLTNELVPSAKFRFKNGEPLYEAPEVPLQELFKPTTQKVLHALKTEPFVIATGPSAIGKSELFLEKSGLERLDAGGIIKRLKSSQNNYIVLNGQGGSGETVLGDIVAGNDIDPYYEETYQKAKYVVVDETTAIMMRTDMNFLPAFPKMVEDGKKLILVGGGKASTEQQMEMIAGYLQDAGLETKQEQMIPIPPYLLTNQQVIEILNVRAGKELSEEVTQFIVQKVDDAKLPKVFRLAHFLPLPIRHRSDQYFIEKFGTGVNDISWYRYQAHVGHIMSI